MAQTCLRVYGEVVLAVCNRIHQPGAVSICRIISISGCDLDYRRACERQVSSKVISQMAPLKVQHLKLVAGS